MATLNPRPEHPGNPPAAGPIALTTAQLFERERLWRSLDALETIEEVRSVAKAALSHWTGLRGAGDWVMGVSETSEPGLTHRLTSLKFEREIDQVSDIRALKSAGRNLIELVFQREAANAWLVAGKCGASFCPAAPAAEARNSAES